MSDATVKLEMAALPNMKPIQPPERKRTYRWGNGDSVTYSNVMALAVQPNGTHRLELAGGKKVIVMPGFIAIELETDAWAF